MEPKMGRRIVSRNDYMTSLGKKDLVAIIGVGMLLASLVCVAVICLIVCFSADIWKHAGVFLALDGVFIITLLSYGMVYIFRIGTRAIRKAQRIDPGIPLTRDNTADLPVPESLVRASEQPLQAQEDILLRAATGGQETPPEQLVRASLRHE